MLWSDLLNMNFSTSIFSQHSEYIQELGNIYSAKAEIDSSLSHIVPNVQEIDKIAKHVKHLMNAMDDLKVATKNCVFDMEE